MFLVTSPFWFKFALLWIFGAFCALLISFSWFGFNLLDLPKSNPILVILGGPLIWILYFTFKYGK